MNRLAVIGLIVVAALAVGVYRAKLGASETEGRNAKLKAEIAAATKDINVMRAEEAFLAQPSRIGPIARRLGLEPSSPEQFTAPEQVGRRVGEARVVLALPAPPIGQAIAPPAPPLKNASQAPAAPRPAGVASPGPSPAVAASGGRPAQ
jgi:cell division protein FtsL